MTKKILLLLVIAMFVVTLSGVYGNRESYNEIKSTKQEEKKAGNIKVTFIELGSVRCIPCKKMMPIMEHIEKKYKGQVNVVFHDVWTDKGKPFAKKYKIRVIPTQVFLDKEGKEYFRHEGFFPKEELVKVLKQKGVK